MSNFFWLLGQLTATGIQILLGIIDVIIVICFFGQWNPHLAFKFTLWRIDRIANRKAYAMKE